MKKAFFLMCCMISMAANAQSLEQLRAAAIESTKKDMDTLGTNSPYQAKILYRYYKENNQVVEVDIENIKENTSDKLVDMVLSYNNPAEITQAINDMKAADIAQFGMVSATTLYVESVIMAKKTGIKPKMVDIVISPSTAQSNPTLGTKRLVINPDAFY